MRDSTITRRRTTAARRRGSKPHPGRGGFAALFIPGLRVAWRAFWHDVAHPRLVSGAVLLFPALALAKTPDLRRPGLATTKPVLSRPASQVQVADSSGYHIHSLTPALFRSLSTGIGVVVWQGTLSLAKEG